jgi:hypothetical protein
MTEYKEQNFHYDWAYLMIHFNETTNIPIRIGVYSEETPTIIDESGPIFDFLVASVKMKVDASDCNKYFYGDISSLLIKKLTNGDFDNIKVIVPGHKTPWTIKQCRELLLTPKKKHKELIPSNAKDNGN